MNSRAIQLGSLFVRGLTHLLDANSACGQPLAMEELMPWHTFDGLLFHSKYLMAHTGTPHHLLLEDNVRGLCVCVCVCVFQKEETSCVVGHVFFSYSHCLTPGLLALHVCQPETEGSRGLQKEG